MNKDVFFVVTIRNKNSDKYIGDSRCWGYFFDLEEAKKTISVNDLDIAEYNHYNYALIEKVPEGICPVFKGLEEVQWYKYDPSVNEYKECEKPEWSRSYCNWAM